MKLGELRGAIRKSKGNPFVRVTLAPGIPELSLVLQKNPLYESLDMAFPDGKGQETGLTFNPENGLLSAEAGATPVAISHASYMPAASDDEPELDLLGDALSSRADDMLQPSDDSDILI